MVKTLNLKKMILLLFFMQRLRDEAHRFAITSHRAKEQKELKIILDQIEGIGSIRKRALLNHLAQLEQLNLLVLMKLKSS